MGTIVVTGEMKTVERKEGVRVKRYFRAEQGVGLG